MVNLILSKQQRDGGWGVNASTLEETAYVVLMLNYWIKSGDNRSKYVKAMCAAEAFLQTNTELHHLWIGKALYLPIYPVKAAVIAAVFAIEQVKYKYN